MTNERKNITGRLGESLRWNIPFPLNIILAFAVSIFVGIVLSSWIIEEEQSVVVQDNFNSNFGSNFDFNFNSNFNGYYFDVPHLNRKHSSRVEINTIRIMVGSNQDSGDIYEMVKRTETPIFRRGWKINKNIHNDGKNPKYDLRRGAVIYRVKFAGDNRIETPVWREKSDWGEENLPIGWLKDATELDKEIISRTIAEITKEVTEKQKRFEEKERRAKR